MKIGLIATSSFSTDLLDEVGDELVSTRYGDVPVRIGTFENTQIFAVRRAGGRHPLEPGRVNYRAMALALRDLHADAVVSTCVVGSLNPDLGPGAIAIPAQFLDFTRHRPPTLFDDHGFGFTDMTEPYCPRLRKVVGDAAANIGITAEHDPCYVGVDGPRYETSAEVKMFRMLGGDVVGHTGVTEAILLREAGLCHVCVLLVSNYAAGITGEMVSNETVSDVRNLHAERLEGVVYEAIPLICKDSGGCQCAAGPGVLQFPQWNQVAPP